MTRTRGWVLGVALTALVGLPAIAAHAATAPSKIKAGVGIADATWSVGAGAGQYATTPQPQNEVAGDADPYAFAVKKNKSYGVESRLSIRALVVEGSNHQRVALVKADNYLAQDLLVRRAAQLLSPSTGIGYEQILLHVTHDHSSPYNLTPAAGVMAFQDAFDMRMLEYEARAMARAITDATTHLRPARMGATNVPFSTFKGNIVGPDVADDGTPAGYPSTFGDLNVTVMRFDDVSGSSPKPLATWMNWGEHPESLDGYDLLTADYLGPLQRFVERATGAPLVFSQGDVGSSEGPYLRGNPDQLPDGTYRAWAHVGYGQMERGAKLLADAVIKGWETIGSGAGVVPFSTDLPVMSYLRWTPGPVSHPYPSISNCRTGSTVDGDPGAPYAGAPDCERSPVGADAPVYENMRAAGIPVPDHYDGPSQGIVEENARLKLQVVRLGDVVLGSCACEAQVDLILNFESRANRTQGDIWDGYDWGAQCTANTSDGGATYTCPDPPHPGQTLTVSKANFDRMEAEVHNDARGWDDPANAVAARSEPEDTTKIWGNFTKEELPAKFGYKLAVGIGHGGDYNGYTVSYREYMSRDTYRKALTSYGPHTADYMVTRLVRMAGFLKGGPALAAEPLQPQADADEARAAASAQVFGAASAHEYDGFMASLPDDVGPAAPLAQPKDISRFDATVFTWRGGSNAIDNPSVRVERRDDSTGQWARFADQSGEVPTFVHFPQGVVGVAETRAGMQEWKWTANFEAYDAFPSTLPSVPSGRYRFVVDGVSRAGGANVPYHIISKSFAVRPWEGIKVQDIRTNSAGTVSFVVPPIDYPRTYVPADPVIRFPHDDGGQLICKTCAFRPWASTASVATAVVTVVRASGAVDRVAARLASNGRWVAATALQPGDRAFVDAGGVVDQNGEINGAASATVTRA